MLVSGQHRSTDWWIMVYDAKLVLKSRPLLTAFSCSYTCLTKKEPGATTTVGANKKF